MKKFFALVLAMCAVSFASCDDDGSHSVSSLANTTWKGSYKPMPHVTVSVTYTFMAKTYNAVATDGGGTHKDTGTYTFVFPDLNMKSSSPNNASETKGTMKHNILSVSTPSGMTLTLTKQ